MQNLLNDLTQLLTQDDRLVVEGKLLKNKVIELALNVDVSLIKLLLKNAAIKQHFFTQVDNVLVFDKIKFQQFVSNKQFLADSYTAFKNKIGLTANGEYLTDSREVVLAWPYKDCVLEGGQDKDDAKRNEVFYNETLAPDQIDRLLSPKLLTNFKRYGKDGVQALSTASQPIISSNDNLIIKGNNLLALHTLKKVYAGKVKLIYIDPPYNTGNDSFGYNDAFNHSTWLTFMRSRLQVAKSLLRDDGFIVLHCDYIEDSYIKVLMDELFGSNCYVNNIAIRDSHPSGLKLSAKNQTIIKTKSTILVYRKIFSKSKINPIYQKRVEWDNHFNMFVDIDDPRLIKESLKDKLIILGVVKDDFSLDKNALNNVSLKNFIFENKNKVFQSTKELPAEGQQISLANPNKVVEYKKGEFALNGRRLSSFAKSVCDIGFDGYAEEDFGKLICDFWDDIDFNNSQREGEVSFPAGKKPELLLARILTMFTNKGDLVLDFFLGSGTTCAVAHKMSRKYIGIEQLNYVENDNLVRIKNVVNGEQSGISRDVKWAGGGSFLYCELARANQTFIDEIQAAAITEQLKTTWQAMQARAFLSYQIDVKAFDANAADFTALSFADQQRFLIEVLDKNMLYVPLSEMDDAVFGITDNDKALNKQFFGL